MSNTSRSCNQFIEHPRSSTVGKRSRRAKDIMGSSDPSLQGKQVELCVMIFFNRPPPLCGLLKICIESTRLDSGNN